MRTVVFSRLLSNIPHSLGDIQYIQELVVAGEEVVQVGFER
jgi:hypothetical protein